MPANNDSYLSASITPRIGSSYKELGGSIASQLHHNTRATGTEFDTRINTVLTVLCVSHSTVYIVYTVYAGSTGSM